LGFGIWDLGFGIWDLGFGIWDLFVSLGWAAERRIVSLGWAAERRIESRTQPNPPNPRTLNSDTCSSSLMRRARDSLASTNLIKAASLSPHQVVRKIVWIRVLLKVGTSDVNHPPGPQLKLKLGSHKSSPQHREPPPSKTQTLNLTCPG